MNSKGRQYPVPGSDNWIVRSGEAKPAASLRLFCFPSAGGGPVDFRDWAMECPDDVEVFSIQLPGRGSRIREPLISRMDILVDSLVAAIARQVDRPFALFGHSLGGRIGFALAQRLVSLGLPAPRLLAVSACRAPGLASINVSNLSDQAFRLHLEQLGGTAPEVLANDELMEILVPVLRADFMLHDSLVAGPERLDCPILACGGDEDRGVHQPDLEAWHGFTSGSFDLRLFPGGHFYLREQRRNLLGVLMAQVGMATATE